MFLNANEENMRYAMKNKLVTHYDQARVDAYEESLRRRNFAKVRHQEDGDNPNADVEYHSEDGKATRFRPFIQKKNIIRFSAGL